MMKKEADGEHPAGDYLIVGDPEMVTTWHLQVKNQGKPDHRLMGAAWAALHGGYRGNRYEGPDKGMAIAELEKLYQAEEMPTPAKSYSLDEWFVDELKAGRTISAATGDALQQILDIVTKLLGLEEQDAQEDSQEGGQEDPNMMGMMSLDATMINLGEAVKALHSEQGKVTVGGYLVRFTGPGDTDLTGDRFAAATDFDFEFPGKSTAYFNHGLDKKMKKRRLAPVTLTRTETGIWLEGLLDERDEYEAGLVELAKAGKLGLSSGVPAHLVEREDEGKSRLITYWPLGKDASYTHTPAESRNVVMPLKSLVTAPVMAADKKSEHEVNMEIDQKEFESLKSAVTAMASSVEDIKRTQPAEIKAGAANPATPRNPNDRPYKTIGDQLTDIRKFNKGQGMSARLEALSNEFKALGANEFISADGGFALQPDFTDALLSKVYNPPGAGTILADVTRQPVSGNGFRALAVDEQSRVSSRRGGFVGYWAGEGTAPTATKAQFRRVGADLEKVIALTYLTDELMSDAPALTAFVNREGPNELRFQLEGKVVNGTGAGVPLGLLNATATVSVAKEAGQAAATVVTENVTKMWSRMPMYLMAGAKWYVNQEILPQLVTLSIAVGVGGQIVPSQIYAYPSAGFPFGQLFGRPVQPVEYCPALGSVGDIILANMGEYFVIENGGVQSASSIHVAFTTDETALRFTYRVNGFPWWTNSMTPYKGSNALSPYITLAAR